MASTPALDLRWHVGVDAPAICELLHAALDDFNPVAIHEADAGEGWRVFFKDRVARDRAALALAAAFPTELTEIHPQDIEDEEWARRSQADLRAVRVGRVIVAPPWDLPAPAGPGGPGGPGDPGDPGDNDAIVVVIDPSTGFGTGHHETTRLCLQLLQDAGVDGSRAIDVGTGSGVLAIAAARLGARQAIAIDDDPDALANAAANVALNGVAGIVVLERADLADFRAAAGDVVTANLTGDVLQRHADRLKALVAPGGVLIASGFTGDESTAVIAAFGAAVDRTASEGVWTAVRLSLPDTRS